MSTKKTIKYEDLVDMLSHDSATLLDDEKRKSFLQKNEQFCSRTGKGPVFDYEAYIRRLESKIAQFGLEKHIIIEDDRKIPILGTSSEHHIKLITVEDLTVKVDRNYGSDMLHFGPLEITPSMIKSTVGLHIIFINNEFTATEKGYNSQVCFLLSDRAYISLVGNTFNNVNMNTSGSTSKGYILELKDNIFDNEHVSVFASSAPSVINEGNLDYTSFEIKGDAIYKWKQGKLLEQYAINKESFKYLELLRKRAEDGDDISLNDIAIMLLNMHSWVRAEPEDMTPRKLARGKSACIILNNNTFKCLEVNVDGYCWFMGKNKIEFLEECTISYCYFGPYQEINPQGNHAEAHKDIFLNLHKKAIEKNDQSQARILQLEIKKCEHNFLRRERGSLAHIQDLVIYNWGYWVSRYSSSWARPIAYLFVVNAIFTFIIMIFFDNYNSIDHVTALALFWEFFNPVSSPAQLLSLDKPTAFLSFINVIQKILLGVLVYESIKAFRRFAEIANIQSS